MILDHIQRIRDGVADTYNLQNLSTWIAKHTKHDGRSFNYVGREYQPYVIDNPAKELYVVKIAQVGLSEILARWGLAATATQPNFTTIYTFPAANDAYLFAKARLDPMIASSQYLKDSLSKSVDSVELKQFGANSFIYTRGTYSETGALSVPADLLIHDEIDRSDLNNVSAYVSRLQAKPTKMRRLFSTPTASKYGISAFADTSKRMRQVWKCSCCGHYFLPTYHNDIHIPGYSDDKKLITKVMLKDLAWKNAVLLCPKCGREPSTDIAFRSWVCENPQDNYDAVSIFISPFTAPAIITPSYLVDASTRFDKWSEFVNQALGETAEDSEETLTESDINACNSVVKLTSTDVHFMGCDMGLTCHIMIGRLYQGTLIVVHRERVFYTEFEKRRQELANEYRVLSSVIDMFPYTDIVTRITTYDPNAFGAIYVEKKSSETHTVKEVEEDPEEGKLNVRSVMVNRNIAFDALMSCIKRKEVIICEIDELFVTHLLDMKRVQKFDKHQVMHYVWEKTAGNDHYHHAFLYLYIASKVASMAFGWTSQVEVPFVTSFRTRA